MPKTLIINYTIPTGSEKWSDSKINFYGWIPSQKEVLCRKKNNIVTCLSFDNTCFFNFKPIDFEEIKKCANNRIFQVNVEVIVEEVSDKLAKFIYDERDSFQETHYGIKPGDAEYDELSKAYLDLGITVLESALIIYNRFIQYARNYKGQHWLSERPYNINRLVSMNNEFNTKVRSENDHWVRWCPPGKDCITMYTDFGESSISQDEWGLVQQFVEGDSRPDLTFVLLANAGRLITEGYRRNAIVEAVSALETAVLRFSKSPKLIDLITDELVNRFDVDKLHSQVKHLGLSATIRYLVPLLFPPNILNTEKLKQCQEAINIRNNIVHNEQRDVEDKSTRKIVVSIEELCKILIKHTN